MVTQKTRHGCLTAYLGFIIVVSVLGVAAMPFSAALIRKSTPTVPSWLLYISTLLVLLDVVFVIAVFRWKMWGFIGFCGVGIITLCIHLYCGYGVGTSLRGVLGAALLYCLLHIGGERKGWSQLE